MQANDADSALEERINRLPQRWLGWLEDAATGELSIAEASDHMVTDTRDIGAAIEALDASASPPERARGRAAQAALDASIRRMVHAVPETAMCVNAALAQLGRLPP